MLIELQNGVNGGFLLQILQIDRYVQLRTSATSHFGRKILHSMNYSHTNKQTNWILVLSVLYARSVGLPRFLPRNRPQYLLRGIENIVTTCRRAASGGDHTGLAKYAGTRLK